MLDIVPMVTRAILVGAVAARAVGTDGRGTVCAVFERSFYITLPGGLICVGPVSLGAGPLNLLCAPSSAAAPLSAIPKPGHIAVVENASLCVGPLRMCLACAEPWHPLPLGAWSRYNLARGLAAFTDALPQLLPDEGLARLLRPIGSLDQLTPVVRAAQAPARYLAQVLETTTATDATDISPARIAPLIGLGPGLTPSGDDYLGGILITLSLIGQTRLRDRLWRAVEPLLHLRTCGISRAHLAAASEGHGSAALHDLLHAVLAGRNDAISTAMETVSAIGHTSGWDTVAGAIAVLRAA